MNRPGSRNRKNKKKIRGALAGAGIVALFLALMISFGKTAPENPMDRNRADASRMYLLSSTLDMDMDQLANIGNANINAGDSANQAEQEEQQQEEEKQEQNQDTPQQEQQQNQDTQNPDQNISDPNIQNAVAADIPGSLMNLIQKNQSGGSGNGSSLADKAALSALRTVLQPFRRLEKFFRLVSALQKCDLVQHFRPFRLFIQRAHQTF